MLHKQRFPFAFLRACVLADCKFPNRVGLKTKFPLTGTDSAPMHLSCALPSAGEERDGPTPTSLVFSLWKISSKADLLHSLGVS